MYRVLNCFVSVYRESPEEEEEEEEEDHGDTLEIKPPQVYHQVPKFLDARTFCGNHNKIQTKRLSEEITLGYLIKKTQME